MLCSQRNAFQTLKYLRDKRQFCLFVFLRNPLEKVKFIYINFIRELRSTSIRMLSLESKFTTFQDVAFSLIILLFVAKDSSCQRLEQMIAAWPPSPPRSLAVQRGSGNAMMESSWPAEPGRSGLFRPQTPVSATDGALPDLVPNATLFQTSTYLQDQTMYFMQCAMEENCAAPSAYALKNTKPDWQNLRRRLLRFSTSTWNYGTADFRPAASKKDWEWHQCHMHYHSMQIFARYDLLDAKSGQPVAVGHKASFCLEDVQCVPAATRKYACRGLGEQGISVGCADDYPHDVDCQWIDITDVKPGKYIFKVMINPDRLVAELDYSNNAATCNLLLSTNSVRVSDCVLSSI